MTVRTEKTGKALTIIIDRPDRRNAVDGPTASALANAFREFEKDAESCVAVLWGRGRAFLRGRGPESHHRRQGLQPDRPRRRRPDGAFADGAVQAGDCGGGRLCRGRGAGTRLRRDLRVVEKSAVFGVFYRTGRAAD